MITERIAKLEQLSAARGKSGIPSHFMKDYHQSAQTLFSNCPLWEKLAKAMAYAIENQDVYVHEDDRIGGRVYHETELPVETPDPDLDYRTEADKAFLAEFPEGDELRQNQLVGGSAVGHITWFFDRILSLGVSGLRARYEEALRYAKDEEATQFYQGVLILLDSMLAFNDKHIEAYEKLGNFELAERMKKVPRYPAETFREAVQAFICGPILTGISKQADVLWKRQKKSSTNCFCESMKGFVHGTAG